MIREGEEKIESPTFKAERMEGAEEQRVTRVCMHDATEEGISILLTWNI